MRGFRVFWGIIFFTLLIMCFAYHSRLVPLLLLTVALICGAAFLTGFITRMCISVEVANPKYNRIFRKERAVFAVRVRNRSVFPLTPVWIHVKVLDEGVYLPKTRIYISAVPPLGDVTVNIANAVSFRGEYNIGFVKAEFCDILKMFRFSLKQNRPYTITAFPRQSEMYRLQNDNPEESEKPHTKPHGLDFNKNTFSHLREYKEGESLRHIHWKVSARMPHDDLIVKQMEADHDYSSLVFCDLTVRFDRTEDFLEATDLTIETAQAIIRQILTNRDSASLISRPKKANADTLQDYYDLTESLALLPAVPHEGDFCGLFDEYSGETALERAVYIITCAVTGEFAAKLQNVGLTAKRGVVLAVVPSALNQSDMVEFLKTKTKIKVVEL